MKTSRRRLNCVKNDIRKSLLLTDINATNRRFFISQKRTQKFKPKGRRFSLEGKVFALTIYKQNSKVYKYLSKIFFYSQGKF